MYYRSAIALTLLSFLFYACTKDPVTTTDPKLPNLMRIIGGIDTIGYSSFFYDSNDRLIKIIDSNNNGHSQVIDIEYSTYDKPVKYIITNNSTSPINISLEYNNKKQAVKKVVGPYPDGSYFTYKTYSYDLKGRIIMSSYYYYRNDLVLAGYEKYDYDKNDNVIKVEEFYKNSGVMQSNYSKVFSYDQTMSPVNNIREVCYFASDNFSWLSRNNVLTSKSSQSADTIKYEYQFENGLVKKVLTKYKFDGGEILEPTEYFYK